MRSLPLSSFPSPQELGSVEEHQRDIWCDCVKQAGARQQEADSPKTACRAFLHVHLPSPGIDCPDFDVPSKHELTCLLSSSTDLPNTIFQLTLRSEHIYLFSVQYPPGLYATNLQRAILSNEPVEYEHEYECPATATATATPSSAHATSSKHLHTNTRSLIKRLTVCSYVTKFPS